MTITEDKIKITIYGNWAVVRFTRRSRKRFGISTEHGFLLITIGRRMFTTNFDKLCDLTGIAASRIKNAQIKLKQ